MKRRKRKNSKSNSQTLLIFCVLIVLIIIAVATAASYSSHDNSGSAPSSTVPTPTYPSVSPPNLPEDYSIDYNETSRSDVYKDNDTELIYLSVTYPTFSGSNKDVLDKIMSVINQHVSNSLIVSEYDMGTVKDDYKRAENSAMPFMPYEYVTRLTSVHLKGNYLSILFLQQKTTSYMQPSEIYKSFVFDLDSGEEVRLSQILNLSSEETYSYFENLLRQDIIINKEKYYQNALSIIGDAISVDNFYLGSDSLVLFCDPDVISYSVNGIIEIKIPYDEIYKK